MVLQGTVGGAVGGGLQGAGDQALHDVKKGKVSSAKQYANVTVQGAAGGAVSGAVLSGAGQALGKGASALKSGRGRSGRPPSDPYDTKAWNKYYEQHPNAKRSVGAAGSDDPTMTNQADAKPAPKVTRLPYIAPKGKQVTAQPTGKTPQTNRNAAALEGRGRRVANAYPRDPLHHVLPQEYRKFFAAPGRGLNVDDYAVSLSEGEHTAVHSVKWNQRWADWIGHHQNATREEVLAFARPAAEGVQDRQSSVREVHQVRQVAGRRSSPATGRVDQTTTMWLANLASPEPRPTLTA